MNIQDNGAAPERVDFSKIKTSIPIPNLIEVQKTSYERFLQMDLLPNEREDIGLQTVFNSVFPISDFRGVSDLEFVDYSIGNWECKCGNLKGLHHLRSTCRNCGATIRTDPFHAGDVLCHHCGTFNKNVVTFCNKCGDPVGLQLKYDMLECQERGMTYAAPLKVTIRLTVYSKDPETQKKSVRDIKEQEVFFGEIPLMTDNGTFIINGTERVIVSQLHRSPGVFFERVPAQGYFLGKIIPYRGSWVEFEYDNKNILYVRIDRKRKFFGSVFLRALGYKTDEQILRGFYRASKIAIKDKKLYWNVDEGLIGLKLSYAIAARGGESVVTQGKKITPSLYKEIQKAKIQQVEVASNDLEGAYLVADVFDTASGEVFADANRRADGDEAEQADGSRRPGLRSILPRARRSGHRHLGHHQEGPGEGAERGADRDLPQAAARRSAHAGHRHPAFPGHVLRSAQVRFFARRPHEVQHQAA
jgi:DNA-directed RNA polymerase subunit beta